jgi:hypothetical protein
MRRTISLFLISLTLIFSGCKKADEYPVEPVISFKSLTTDKDANGKDVAGHITISFTDGDGDLGLNPSDTLSPYNRSGSYYYNFVIKYYEKINNVWTLVTTSTPFSGRFPLLTPEGKNKALRGDISQQIFLKTRNYWTNPNAPYLEVKYDVFIYDRALHRSNTITTSELIIDTNTN